MLGWLPRRFRSRALLAITLLGTCFLVTVYYSPLPSDGFFKIHSFGDQSLKASWWGLLWTASERCESDILRPATERVDTADFYPKLPFNVPDNGGLGFWSEILESRYREIRKTWKDLPLEVIVVPHSHVDPGWLRTYDDYSSTFVSHILDNMVTFLNKTEEFKFIWSEVSFFSDWWYKQNSDTKNLVKKFLQRKQLEFVTGGWVMPDEATTNYFGLIHQLIEGHQWLKHFTGVTPKCGWSVDVFGHSASVPYVLTSAGLTEMVILRIHYAWKALLAKKRWFDFYWEQPFESPRILCHVAPSDLYSFKHTCGPDPFVCLKYDFRRVGGEYSESTADEITEKNVELKAGYLLSQYGRYASLFPHNVLLVPLGDDFRYNLYIEWVQQFENYQKLFKYINNRKDWNTHIRFGTISDYFEEVNRRLRSNATNLSPSIQGDFFPYADTYADSRPSYWNGFYSTRPFYKMLSQELESWLRAAEILYSLSKTNLPRSSEKIAAKDYSSLISARQNLALFQHHDAITGTSKDAVMMDYGRRLHAGITDAMSVISHASQLLLMEDVPEGRTWTSQVYPDAYRSAWNQPTKKLSILIPNGGRKIIIFNPLTLERVETVRLKVRSPNVKVVDSNGNYIPLQINPVWKDNFVMSNSIFELIFVASLKPLSFCTYTVLKLEEGYSYQQKAVVSLFVNDDTVTAFENSAFKFEKPKDEDISLDSHRIGAKFLRSGNLKEIYLKESGLLKSLNIDFKSYIPKEYRSGAYLFHPTSNQAIPLRNLTDHFPLLCVVRGPLVSELNILYHSFLKVSVRLYNYNGAPQGLQLDISSDISKISRDVELIMKFHSDIKNAGIFFTDSNGLQMLRRKHVPQLPIQGNYYPVTSAMFIQDETFRLSVLVSHSHGAASVAEGELEIMLDRKMRNDDLRGVGQGISDNQLILSSFWLVPESVTGSRFDPLELSPDAHALSLFLKNRLIHLVTENAETKLIRTELSFISKSWPRDVHLVNLRTLPINSNYNRASNSSLMIIYERHDSCKIKSFIDSISENMEFSTFSHVKMRNITKTSLTGTLMISNQDPVSSSAVLPKLQACIIHFT